MPPRRPSRWQVLLCLTSFALAGGTGCARHVTRKHTTDVRTVDRQSAFIKAHMKDGSLYVLSRWSVDPAGAWLTGDGELSTINRQASRRGWFKVAVADVALFETNVVHPAPSVVAMAVISGVSAAVTVMCLTNTKSCFGSCPTFYAGDGAGQPLQAEGFSDSVAPSLEASDVDALHRVKVTGRDLNLRMTNEALETHVVKKADLLAVPRPQTPGGRVFAAADGSFWQASAITTPSSCTAAEGSCLPAVTAMDGQERTSPASETDLAEREQIELTFPASATTSGRQGITLAFRQSLLSTYVLYQGLAYMGRNAGYWLAALERGDKRLLEQRETVLHVLGGIEVLLPDQRGRWEKVGEIKETGPLATDVHLLPLPPGARADRVRLRLTRGHWRLDQVARVTMLGDKPVRAVRLSPTVTSIRQSAQFAPERPPFTGFPLVTLPGDEYRLTYRLPEAPESHELFLESRGYYLEWMRKEWLADEDPLRAMMMVVNPRQALRTMAPQFKRQEASMEQAFWQSRYAHP